MQSKYEKRQKIAKLHKITNKNMEMFVWAMIALSFIGYFVMMGLIK